MTGGMEEPPSSGNGQFAVMTGIMSHYSEKKMGEIYGVFILTNEN